MGSNFFCLKLIFLSGLIRKFHIKFAIDNVFDLLDSTKIIQWSIQWFILFTPSLNDVVSTKNGHTKASSTFQLMTYNDLIDLFKSVNDSFLWVHSLWIIIMLQISTKTFVTINFKLLIDIVPVKKSIKEFDWRYYSIFHWFKVYLAKIVSGHISHSSNPFWTLPIAERQSQWSLHTV